MRARELAAIVLCHLGRSSDAIVEQIAGANAIRALSMDAVQAANSGHPGMPMGMADVATVLFTEFLKYDPKAPDWPDRDRFVLSAGHGSMLLYSLLYLTGYKDITIDEIKKFRQLGSKTAGHPEYGEAAGIEMTTGPLGQGLAMAVGMAMAWRAQSACHLLSLLHAINCNASRIPLKVVSGTSGGRARAWRAICPMRSSAADASTE